MLEAFDYGVAVRPPQLPSNRASEQAKLMWLHSAAHLPSPVSTFQKNSPEKAEADELLKFLEAKETPSEQSLVNLSLSLTGSQLALWRFGQAATRRGDWNSDIRRKWEGRLLEEKIHPLIRGFALRHALCWALAENDEMRLARLKGARASQDMPEIFIVFQKAFSTIGGPLSALRLWTSDLVESQSGIQAGEKAWVCPDSDFPPYDKTSTWVIPLLEPQGIENAESPTWRNRAEKMLDLPILTDYKVSFAPYQRDLGLLGIAFFPALICLDESGNVAKIQMGDACPRAATDTGVMLSPDSDTLQYPPNRADH